MSAQGTYRFCSVYRQTTLLVNGEALAQERVNNVKNYVAINNVKNYVPVNPLPPMSAKWHLQILLCLTPDDFTRQRGTP